MIALFGHFRDGQARTLVQGVRHLRRRARHALWTVQFKGMALVSEDWAASHALRQVDRLLDGAEAPR